MNKLKFLIGCYLRKHRLMISLEKLKKASMRLKEAREERAWIESNPHIHIFNYPYYKARRLLRC